MKKIGKQGPADKHSRGGKKPGMGTMSAALAKSHALDTFVPPKGGGEKKQYSGTGGTRPGERKGR